MIIAAIVTGSIVVAGGIFVATSGILNEPKATGNNVPKTSTSSKVTLVDPDGTYTKYPEKDALFGNGQTLTFEYDGSKTNNDAYATLSYYPYYIQDDGKVQPLGGGNIQGRGKGTFTVSSSVFNSDAKDRQGFLEVIGTYDTGTDASGKVTGSNVKLGMYPIIFDVAD